MRKESFVEMCDLLIADNKKHEELHNLGIDCSILKEEIYNANSLLLRGCFCEWKAELIEDYLYPVFGERKIEILDENDYKKVVNLIDSHEKLWEYLNSNED